MSSELLHIKNKSRAWEKTDTLAQKLEKKRLARLRSVKSALKQKKVTRQSAAKLRHINNRKNSRRAGKHAKFSHTENSENSADAGNVPDDESAERPHQQSRERKKRERSKIRNQQKPLQANENRIDATTENHGTHGPPANESSSILENMTRAFNAMQAPKLVADNNVHHLLGLQQHEKPIEFGPTSSAGKPSGVVDKNDASVAIRIRGEASSTYQNDKPLYIAEDVGAILQWGDQGKPSKNVLSSDTGSASLIPNFQSTSSVQSNQSNEKGLPPTSPKKMSILSTSIDLDKAMKNINKRSGVSLRQLEDRWEQLGLPPHVEPLTRGISRSTVGSRGSLPSRGSMQSRGSIDSDCSVSSNLFNGNESNNLPRQSTASKIVSSQERSRRLEPLPKPPRTSPTRLHKIGVRRNQTKMRRNNSVPPLKDGKKIIKNNMTRKAGQKWRGGGCADPHKRDERARAHAIKKKMQQDSRARARAWREKHKQTCTSEYDINGIKKKKVERIQFSSYKGPLKHSQKNAAKNATSNPETHDTAMELNEAKRILAEISKPVGSSTTSGHCVSEDIERTKTKEEGDNQEILDACVSEHDKSLANALSADTVPKLDLSNVEPDIDSTSDEGEDDTDGEDEGDQGCFIETQDHTVGSNGIVQDKNTEDINKAERSSMSHSYEKESTAATPKPMENATLSFLSEYSKRALQQAEKALFSPQDFSDVIQHSTSEEEDDESLL